MPFNPPSKEATLDPPPHTCLSSYTTLVLSVATSASHLWRWRPFMLSSSTSLASRSLLGVKIAVVGRVMIRWLGGDGEVVGG